MKNFLFFFLFELKRFFCKRNFILLLAIFFFSHILVNLGIKDLRKAQERKDKFSLIEEQNFKKFKSYKFYGDEGIRYLFNPAKSSILFKNTPITNDLLAITDSIVTLRIFNNFKGKSLYPRKFFGPFGFSDIIIIFCSLLALFYGYETLREKEALRQLSSLKSEKIVFFNSILSRFLILFLTIILLFSTIFLNLFIEKIRLPFLDYQNITAFIFSAILMLFFFFMLGVIIGNIWPKKGGILAIMVVWFTFLFLIPGIINTIIENNAVDSTKDYQTEIDKFKIIEEFEEKAIEINDRFDRKNIEGARKIIEDYYWKLFYKKIETREQKLKDEIFDNINVYRKVSLFLPTNFCYLTGDSVSSRGYENFNDFYSYLQEMKKKFVRFWIDRVYYHDPKVLVNFIKKDENLFHAKSRLPKNFLTGILITLGYVIILFIVSYFLFLNSLYKIKKDDIEKLDKVDIELNNGDLQLWAVKGHHFKNLLFNLFSGNYNKVNKKGFTGKVLINGVDIASEKSKEDFLYICQVKSIPGDLRVKDFINLYARMLKIPAKEKRQVLKSPGIKDTAGKTFSNLSNEKRFAVLLSLLEMGKKQVYLIYNIAAGLPVECGVELNKKMNELKDRGSLVIYLTTTIRQDSKEVEMDEYYSSGKGWEYMVKGFEESE